MYYPRGTRYLSFSYSKKFSNPKFKWVLQAKLLICYLEVKLLLIVIPKRILSSLDCTKVKLIFNICS